MPAVPPPRKPSGFIPAPVLKPVRNGLLAGVIMAGIAVSRPDQYKCEAHILPTDLRGGGGIPSQMALVAAAAGITVPGLEGADAAFGDILASRWMAKNLLQEDYHFSQRTWRFGPPREHNESLYTYFRARNLDQACRTLRSHLTVGRDTKTKLLTIAAETQSPALSQQIVHKAVTTLEYFIEAKARTRGGSKAAFTAERVREAEAARAGAERDCREFLGSHRNYATSNDPAVRLEGGRLEAALRLRQQVVATLTLNHEQALLEEKNDMPILNILDEGDLPQEKDRPARARMVLLAALAGGGGTLLWSLVAARLALPRFEREEA